MGQILSTSSGMRALGLARLHHSSRQVMMNALTEGYEGDSSLFNLIRTQPEKGFLEVRSEPGTTRLKYAWQQEREDGGRVITLIADRLLPLPFVRDWSPDTFTIIHLELDADGTGTGSAAIGATVTWDDEAKRIKIGIENTEPIRITSVHKVE